METTQKRRFAPFINLTVTETACNPLTFPPSDYKHALKMYNRCILGGTGCPITASPHRVLCILHVNFDRVRFGCSIYQGAL